MIQILGQIWIGYIYQDNNYRDGSIPWNSAVANPHLTILLSWLWRPDSGIVLHNQHLFTSPMTWMINLFLETVVGGVEGRGRSWRPMMDCVRIMCMCYQLPVLYADKLFNSGSSAYQMQNVVYLPGQSCIAGHNLEFDLGLLLVHRTDIPYRHLK